MQTLQSNLLKVDSKAHSRCINSATERTCTQKQRFTTHTRDNDSQNNTKVVASRLCSQLQLRRSSKISASGEPLGEHALGGLLNAAKALTAGAVVIVSCH